MVRIPLCPEDDTEMDLMHRGFDLDQWSCPACGETHTVLAAGTSATPTAPLDTLAPGNLRWVEREVGPRFGRITTEDGG